MSSDDTGAGDEEEEEEEEEEAVDEAAAEEAPAGVSVRMPLSNSGWHELHAVTALRVASCWLLMLMSSCGDTSRSYRSAAAGGMT